MQGADPEPTQVVSILRGEPFTTQPRELHRYGWPAVVAVGMHVAVLLVGLAGLQHVPEPNVLETAIPTTLIFRIEVGPGGGGGGGGEGSREPASVLRIEGDDPPGQAVPPVRAVPEPVPSDAPLVYQPEWTEPDETDEPLDSPVPSVDAPLVPRAPDAFSQKGVLEGGVPGPESAGPGTGGGAGTGTGTGLGPGEGAGVGEGHGGGFGGGARRLGSGVEPPVVVRSFEPDYTEDALRRKVQGDVVLEIVIDADGRVVDARVVRGLDPGLDRNAVTSVSRWRFLPAKFQGQAVAVIAEVVVEFRVL